jgi:hypothetical protein
MLYGFIQMLRKGTDHYITLVVVFGITQNVGALAGSAMMGSYQIERAHVHSDDLAAQVAISVSSRRAQSIASLSDPISICICTCCARLAARKRGQRHSIASSSASVSKASAWPRAVRMPARAGLAEQVSASTA